ncbi:unnamed protein product [Protopolystoma xenopodis]|uniref:Uncharacterized protein n=1 Tax=Protopolystoma xenopodis TaxID=117903 RepID=A0A3S5CK35_9PLAT|nr:unnamed protein product [Protopolystoma xenopodis]
MVSITDDVDNDAAETFENVPSLLSDAGHHDNHYGRRLRTSLVQRLNVELTSISSERVGGEEIRRSVPPEDKGRFLLTSFVRLYWKILADTVFEAIFFDSGEKVLSFCPSL